MVKHISIIGCLYTTLATKMANTTNRFDPFDEGEDIEEYFERLEMFLSAQGVQRDRKVAHILSDIGSKAYAVLKNLLALVAPKDSSLANIKKALIDHYKPKPPVIGQRFIFHQRVQMPGESVNDFLVELRRLARTCDFNQFLEEALRDRLVCGLANKSTQKKLLSEKNLTLERVFEIAVAAKMAVLSPVEDTGANTEAQTEIMIMKQVCRCCGKQGHSETVCRFRYRACHKCGVTGHLQAVCTAKSNTSGSKKH